MLPLAETPIEWQDRPKIYISEYCKTELFGHLEIMRRSISTGPGQKGFGDVLRCGYIRATTAL